MAECGCLYRPSDGLRVLSLPQRRWGTCAVVGGIVGAGAGAGIGFAIASNNGDHENNAYGIGAGAGVGLVLGTLAGTTSAIP